MGEARTAGYYKLRDGGWGVRVRGDNHDGLKAGDEVIVVRKKDGQEKAERIAQRVATFDDASIYGIDRDWF